MCGIVGYVGDQQALDVVDRTGCGGSSTAATTPPAWRWSPTARCTRPSGPGKLANLDVALAEHPLPPATTGIGHTRWATHGAPNDVNAHPHTDTAGRVAVIHNGIIENFAALRAELEAGGHDLVSETDTEAVAHLLGRSPAAARRRPRRRDARRVPAAGGRVHAGRGRRLRPATGGRRTPQLTAGGRPR